MNLHKIFGDGIRSTNKNGRTLVYLWLANFLFSLLVLAPFYFLLSSNLSRSLAGYSVLRGIDFLWLGDMIYKYQDLLPALLGWAVVPIVFYLGLSIFLNGGVIGGIISRAGKNEKMTLASFFGDCGKYFFRFFRIFLISLVAYALVFGLLVRFISGLLGLWNARASTEWGSLISSNLGLLITLLLLSMVQMFFDYVKIRVVVEESRKTARATLSTLKFVGKNFLKAWLLYLSVAVLFILVSAVFLLVGRILPELSPVYLAIIFIWQQLYVLARMWTKVLFFSTEYQFFKIRQISQAPSEPS